MKTYCKRTFKRKPWITFVSFGDCVSDRKEMLFYLSGVTAEGHWEQRGSVDSFLIIKRCGDGDGRLGGENYIRLDPSQFEWESHSSEHNGNVTHWRNLAGGWRRRVIHLLSERHCNWVCLCAQITWCKSLDGELQDLKNLPGDSSPTPLYLLLNLSLFISVFVPNKTQ